MTFPAANKLICALRCPTTWIVELRADYAAKLLRRLHGEYAKRLRTYAYCTYIITYIYIYMYMYICIHIKFIHIYL